MADTIDPATRSRVMSRIRGKNTAPEMRVRSYLHSRGLRFRLHSAKLPGRPDIVLPRWSAVILVHGCFWHRHPGCRFAYTPKSRQDFWERKFTENVARDQRSLEALQSAGWRVFVIWECETRDESCLARLYHEVTSLEQCKPVPSAERR